MPPPILPTGRARSHVVQNLEAVREPPDSAQHANALDQWAELAEASNDLDAARQGFQEEQSLLASLVGKDHWQVDLARQRVALVRELAECAIDERTAFCNGLWLAQQAFFQETKAGLEGAMPAYQEAEQKLRPVVKR